MYHIIDIYLFYLLFNINSPLFLSIVGQISYFNLLIAALIIDFHTCTFSSVELITSSLSLSLFAAASLLKIAHINLLGSFQEDIDIKSQSGRVSAAYL